MEVVYERCCGVDVHKKTVVACLIVPGPRGRPSKEIRTFGTMTEDLLQLVDWLTAAGCTHLAMESTGVYWKPLYNLVEGTLEVLVVNAQHIKQVPGRKTDVQDCEWIADLLRHGLLRPSFIPDRPQRELRELTRYRTSLIQERAAEINRLCQGGTSWQRCSSGRAMPPPWHSWLGGSSAPSSRTWRRRWSAKWATTSASSSRGNWPISTSWTTVSSR
jgi:hypothetical protein